MDRFAVQTDLFRINASASSATIFALSRGRDGGRGPLVYLGQLERRGRVVARIMNSAQRMERMIGDPGFDADQVR
jgi:hypothetical protein